MKQRIKLSLLLLVMSLGAMAQEIDLRTFSQAPQFIPSADQVRDWDNEPCALIKIQGAKIDSVSGAFQVSKHGAETWVYMTAGDRRLTIYKQGYQPKTVAFDDFGIEGVKSNRVYLLVIYAAELDREKKWFIGVHGGANFASSGLGAGYNKGDVKMVTGFNLGATATYKFTDMLGLTGGLFYSMKGYKYSDMNIRNEECQGHFLDVPILATYFWEVAPTVGIEVLAGPYFGLNVGGKVTADYPWRDDKFSDAFKSLDYGLQLGVGATFLQHYMVNASYQYGLGLDNYTNKNICLNIGYIF